MPYRLTTYVGSKANHVEMLYSYFPDEFDVYVEPFCGSFSVFLNLPEFDKLKKGLLKQSHLHSFILNDIDYDLVALCKTILFQPKRLFEATTHIIKSNEARKEIKYMNLDNLDDFQKAVRKLYLLNTSFSGKWGQDEIGRRYTNPRAVSIYDTFEELKEIKKRLSYSFLYSEDWRKFLERLISVEDKKFFLFLDPPYYKIRKDHYEYAKDFDFIDFAEFIKDLPENFEWLLTINNHEELQKIFQEYYISEEAYKYSSANNRKKEDQGEIELVITNYKKKELLKKKSLQVFF